MDSLDAVASEYGTKIPLYGHAADGNLHAHILDDLNIAKLGEIKEKIYKKAVELGGTITAEHGIGKIRRELLSLSLTEKEMEIMRGIKGILDPENLLNPECKI